MTTQMEQHIGRVMRHLRRERGWTQAQMAEKLGISAQALSAKEKGKIGVSPQHWPDIARAFDMTVEQLLTLAAQLNGSTDSGLRTVVDKWADLPPEIQATIVSLVKNAEQAQ